MRLSRFAVVGFVACACSKSSPAGPASATTSSGAALSSSSSAQSSPSPTNVDGGAIDSPPDASAAAPAPDADAGRTLLGYAHFEKDELYSCTDRDAGDEVKVGRGVVRLKHACTEQFRGRVVLATCEGARTTTRYYAFAAVGLDDARMAECLRDGGEWAAEPRDSKIWKDAKAEYEKRHGRSRRGPGGDPGY